MQKKIYLIASVLAFSLSAYSQTNETDNSRYSWGRKGTDPAAGYIVLKSGTRMAGMLQLKGDPGAIKKIVLTTSEGKLLELDPVSLTAYGLNVGPLINDTPEEMYEWRNCGTTTVGSRTTTVYKTKERRGYAILNDGKRIDGKLHLHKENDLMDEVVIDTEKEGKVVLKSGTVSHYGLIPTIADLTKGGSKNYDDEGRNFHKGNVLKADGSKLDGMLAFRTANSIPNSDAVSYRTVYYAPSVDEPVTVIENVNLNAVTQFINDTAVYYVPYNGGFVEKNKMASLSVNDQFKLLLPGKIKKADNSEEEGLIAQIIPDGSEYCTTIKFKDKSGVETLYGIDKVIYFEQTIKPKSYHFKKYDDRFVHLEFDGKTFQYFKNPNPTTVNKRATNAMQFGASLTTSLATSVTVQSMKGVSDDSKEKYHQNISSASSAELKQTQKELDKVRQIETLDKETKQNVAKAEAAIAVEQIGRTVGAIVIYNVEYFILNKKSGEKSMVIKANFAETIEPLLKSCDTFLLADKAEQKKFKEITNVQMSLQMLDDCYK